MPKVLMIDDEVEMFFLIKRTLKHINFTWLPTLKYGLDFLDFDKSFDLILFDLHGTSMPAFFDDYVRQLSETLPGKVIAVSGVFSPMELSVPFCLKKNLMSRLIDIFPKKPRYNNLAKSSGKTDQGSIEETLA